MNRTTAAFTDSEESKAKAKKFPRHDRLANIDASPVEPRKKRPTDTHYQNEVPERST